MAKYFELLKAAITNQQNTLLLWVVFFYIVLLIIDVATIKKLPYTGSILLFIWGLFSLMYVVSRNSIPASVINFLIKNFSSIRMAVINCILYFLTITALIYIWKINQLKNMNAFIIRGYRNVLPKIMFIVNSNGKVIYETNFGLDSFNANKNIKKTIKKNIDSILINDQIIEKNSFFEVLNSCNDLEEFNLKIVNNQSGENEIDLIKQNIYFNNKYVGYIVYEELEANTFQETTLDIPVNPFLNSFDEPLAYYKTIEKSYYLNKAMAKFLKVNQFILTEEEFKEFILPTDLSFFIQKPDELSLNKKNFFRLLVGEKTYWFEANYEHDCAIIRRTSVINQRNKLLLKTHVDLADDINKLLHNQQDFGLITLSFVNLLDVSLIDGKDLSNALISQYFKTLLDGPYKNEIEIYQLGNIEFGLLVNNLTNFDIITREIIDNRATVFKEVAYVLNNQNIKIDLAVGLLSSKNIENLNPEEIISAGYEALQEALDPKYPNSYSIYYPKAQVVKEYRLEDFDIDLSEDFLKKYKID